MCPQLTSIHLEKPVWAWYALYTRHQHEKCVARSLSGKGVETFLPLFTSTHRWADRSKEISLPLFPCYVFVRGEFVGQELPIVTTPGVYGFVRYANQAAMIPEAEIEAVRRMVESSLGIEPHPFLKRGDWVRIRSGPLTGLEGILSRRKNHYRIVLSVEMLQKSVAIDVDASTVERVAKHKAARFRGVEQSFTAET
jgi:transcription antitermination factor NusG